LGTRRSLTRASHDPVDKFRERAEDPGKSLARHEVVRATPGDQHRIGIGRQTRALPGERLAQEPLDAVAFDGPAHLA
jgi:hypothetical protein